MEFAIIIEIQGILFIYVKFFILSQNFSFISYLNQILDCYSIFLSQRLYTKKRFN